MRIAVCEAAAVLEPGGAEWTNLCEQSSAISPDLFLLNELPFGEWFSAKPDPSDDIFDHSVAVHERGIELLPELGADIVLGSRPLREGDARVNSGFVWTQDAGTTAVHNKQFFPHERGYYEARWFDRGNTDFNIHSIKDIRVGFLICTEVMFNEWARYYGRNGANLIVCPRATEGASLYKWEHALAMAAIVSGCYVASSNRNGVDEFGLPFAGKGMIFDPKGHLIAETSDDTPVAEARIDLELVAKAKTEYPCHAEDLPSAFASMQK